LVMLGRAPSHNCSFVTIENTSLTSIKKPFPLGVLIEMVIINPCN